MQAQMGILNIHPRVIIQIQQIVPLKGMRIYLQQR